MTGLGPVTTGLSPSTDFILPLDPFEMESRIQKINEALIDEIVRAMGLPQFRLLHRLIHFLFGRGTQRFAELIVRLDREVERNGAMMGARWLLSHFVTGYEARGEELPPSSGPLIIASNHPAAYDAMVITACVPRPDFRIIIGDIPTFRFLPNVSRFGIFSPDPQYIFGRMITVRHAIQHLKAGGALLTFPRGAIEPDPDFMPNPEREFPRWSRSLDVFLRSVPRTRVLITTVSGVISRRIFHHPITWLRKQRQDKQRLAFMYQIIRQVLKGRELFGLKPQVTFGEVLTSLHPGNIQHEIEQAARRTLLRHLDLLRQKQESFQ
ncbi:MAG: hypothetical protein FJZ87_04265 [Chloroflexi bacterium]|nr:hypothetical protein [Chloroflexota bacterium]